MSEYSIAEAMRLFLKQSRLKGDVLALQITEVWGKDYGQNHLPVIPTISKFTELHYTSKRGSSVKTGVIIKEKSGRGLMKLWARI
jgi:hypothetical protein